MTRRETNEETRPEVAKIFMMQEKETRSREENPFIIHSSFPRVPLTTPCYYLTSYSLSLPVWTMEYVLDCCEVR